MDFDCKRSPDTKLDIDLMTLISIQTNTKELKLRVVSSLLFFCSFRGVFFFSWWTRCRIRPPVESLETWRQRPRPPPPPPPPPAPFRIVLKQKGNATKKNKTKQQRVPNRTRLIEFVFTEFYGVSSDWFLFFFGGIRWYPIIRRLIKRKKKDCDWIFFRKFDLSSRQFVAAP